MKNPLRFCMLIILIGLGLFTGCGQRPADLVLMNGKIVTVDKALPEAEALAVRGDRVVLVGTAEDMKPLIDADTEIIDLQGNLAIPGFTDSHGHFMSMGRSKMVLNLMKANNWDEIVSMVKEAVSEAEPGEWILGRGWHQEKWNKKPWPNIDGLPLHESLSRVSQENPVLLSHASGHSCYANAKAMELAGITPDTPDPSGGEIVKDRRGNRSGPVSVAEKPHSRSCRRRTKKDRGSGSRRVSLQGCDEFS